MTSRPHGYAGLLHHWSAIRALIEASMSGRPPFVINLRHGSQIHPVHVLERRVDANGKRSRHTALLAPISPLRSAVPRPSAPTSRASRKRARRHGTQTIYKRPLVSVHHTKAELRLLITLYNNQEMCRNVPFPLHFINPIIFLLFSYSVQLHITLNTYTNSTYNTHPLPPEPHHHHFAS